MGQPAPYQYESESDLAESDDEQIVAVMSDDKFDHQVAEIVHSIIEGDYSMEAGLFNIQ